ncbi:MAG: 3-deoxy-manno-octulosonate cytidylyltransferase [Alphaproteobacteria bacterium]
MKNVIIIPARYASSRLPGKPLQEIVGHSMIKRVWAISKSVKSADGVFVATDDARIKEHVESFGGDVLMTASSCENGTARVWDAVQQLPERPENILNVQGDAPLIPPWVLSQMFDVLEQDKDADIVTPAVKWGWDKFLETYEIIKKGEMGGTFVTFDKTYKALYFSKAPIPFPRKITVEDPPLYRHIGLYGYRMDALAKYVGFAPTKLEEIEGLEQLRALENGMTVKVSVVDYKGRTHGSVDNPDDIARAEEIIKAEGELVL